MRFLRDQGLAITMFGIFAVTMVGLVLAGWNHYNGEQIEHSMPTITLAQYLTTPSFGEAVFENWESEFLQMGAYVLLTAFLFSRGSSESKDPDSDAAPQDADPSGGRPQPDRGPAMWRRTLPATPLSSTGPISVKTTGAPADASTTAWLTRTSPGRA